MLDFLRFYFVLTLECIELVVSTVFEGFYLNLLR